MSHDWCLAFSSMIFPEGIIPCPVFLVSVFFYIFFEKHCSASLFYLRLEGILKPEKMEAYTGMYGTASTSCTITEVFKVNLDFRGFSFFYLQETGFSI